jgi:hypothetical protein
MPPVQPGPFCPPTSKASAGGTGAEIRQVVICPCAAFARTDPAVEKADMPRRIARGLPLALVGIFLLVRRAYGYVDPGTGSYVLMTLLASLLTLTYTLKIYWRHVAGFFRCRFGRDRPGEKPEK